jgi:hypothetical protein
LLIACKPDIKSGFYSGNISKKDNQGFFVEMVQSEFRIKAGNNGRLEVRDSDSHLIEVFDLKWNKKNNKIKFNLDRLGLVAELAPIDKVKHGDRMHCYSGGVAYAVQLCFTQHDQFYLNISSQNEKNENFILSLDGIYDAQQAPLVMEPAKDFTRSEALQNVYSKSFDQMIEYQLLLQAKQRSIATWLKLLPSLSFKNMLAISSLDPMKIVNFAGDFVPFIFPSRWFQAKEAALLYDAEKLTLDILRSDLAYNIEIMAFSFDRDQMNGHFYEEQRVKIRQALHHIEKMDTDRVGNYEIGRIGTVADELVFRLDLVENFIYQDKNRLVNAIELGKTALAFQMGFMNPYAVLSFDVESDPYQIETATPLEAKKIIKLALDRSLELKQLDLLINKSEYQKRQWYFNWMDMDVPAHSAISTTLIPNLKRASAYTGEMIQRRNKVVAQIQLNAANAVINYNRALELYKITDESVGKLRLREDLIYEDIENSMKTSDLHTNGPGAQYALNTYFQYQLRRNDAITAFRIAEAQIRRILFEYYYSGVQPRVLGLGYRHLLSE